MQAFRIYHLAFAAAVIIAWATAEELGLVHAWTGYLVAALLGVRLLLAGARARGFELHRMTPRAAAPAGQTGMRHPAIGRTLILALMLCVATTAGTGIAMDRGGTLVGQSIRADDEADDARGERGERGDADDEALAAPSSLLGLAPPARADDGDEEVGEGEEGLLGEIHETAGNLLLPLALLHVLWLALFRFPLARFMLFVPRRRQA